MYVNVQQMYVCKTNPEALQEKKVYLHENMEHYISQI